MTKTTDKAQADGLVEVTQADEAAAEKIVAAHCEAWRWGPFNKFSGTAECGLAVRAAATGIASARHRLTLPSDAADMREAAAKVAECAYDDRPRTRSGQPGYMDWDDGYREGTRAAGAAIRAIPTPSAGNAVADDRTIGALPSRAELEEAWDFEEKWEGDFLRPDYSALATSHALPHPTDAPAPVVAESVLDRGKSIRMRLDDIRDERHFPAHMLDCHDEMLELLDKIEALSATTAPGSVERAGFKLVPIEPTEAMLQAGADNLFGAAHDDWTKDAKLVWSAMLAAVPEVQEQ